MRIAIAVVLALFACPSFAQSLVLRGEQPLSAPEFGPVREPMTHPRVVANGDTYAAIWTDSRNGEPQAYAARFKQDGRRLDPLGIHITPSTQGGAIVAVPDGFLLIYVDRTDIYSRTLSLDGYLGTPTLVFDGVNDPPALDLVAATNGTSVLVASDTGPALMLDLQGRKQREIEMPWASAYRGIDVASVSGSYMIVAGSDRVHTLIVNADGSRGALNTITPIPVHSAVSIATDGAKYFVVWSRDDVEGQLFEANGNAIGEIHALTTIGGSGPPSVAWRDGEYFVTYTEQFTKAIYGLRVAATGNAISQPARTTSKTDYAADIATIGASGVALWTSAYGGMEAAFFDADSLVAADPFRTIMWLSDAAHRQYDIHLARHSDGSIVAAWMEQIGTTSEVRVSRGPGSVPVIASPVAMDRLIDVVVEDNVVWVITSRGPRQHVQRFDSALRPIDAVPQGIIPFSPSGNPAYGAVASGNGAVMLVAQKESEVGTDNDIGAVLMRSGAAGIEVKEVEGLPSGEYEDSLPAVVFDGDDFVIAWARATAPPADFGEVPVPDQFVRVRVNAQGEFEETEVAWNLASAITTLHGASNANGVAFVWQTLDDLSPMVMSRERGEAPKARALETDARFRIADMAPLGDRYVLLASSSTYERAFDRQEMTLLAMHPQSGFEDLADLGSIATSDYWISPDVDLLGGASVTLAYARLGSDFEYGGASRIFVQQSSTGKRRAIR